MSWTTEQLEGWIGSHAVDPTGHRIGTISDVYVDDATALPEWIAVTTGLFGTRLSFVPLSGAQEINGEVHVAFTKAVAKDSPHIDADGQLSQEEEKQLYAYYDIPYSSTDTADSDVAVTEVIDPIEMQESGSASVLAEVSVETARTRLRKRDAQAIEAIDLESE